MSDSLRILLLVFCFCWFAIILYMIRKEKIPVKYSMIWFFIILILMLVAIVPDVISQVTKLLGFATTSNMLIGIILTLLLFLTLFLTKIVSNQKKTITLLTQELSILKKKINRKK